jgi:hypothetical protein
MELTTENKNNKISLTMELIVGKKNNKICNMNDEKGIFLCNVELKTPIEILRMAIKNNLNEEKTQIFLE